MSGFMVPTLLAWSADKDGPEERREWVARLPETVRLVGERWGLDLGAPYQPGGTVSWVAPARTAAGADVVLKVGWGHPDAAHEADALRTWAGHGAVLLHDAWAFDDTSALLLERCEPGGVLGDRPGDEQDVVVADLLTRLWQAPTDGPFRTLDAMCQEWADEHEADVAAGGIAGGAADPLDPGLVRTGLELYRALAVHHRPHGAALHRPARGECPVCATRTVARHRSQAARRRPDVRHGPTHAQPHRPPAEGSGRVRAPDGRPHRPRS